MPYLYVGGWDGQHGDAKQDEGAVNLPLISDRSIGIVVSNGFALHLALDVSDPHRHHQYQHQGQFDCEKELHTPLLGSSVATSLQLSHHLPAFIGRKCRQSNKHVKTTPPMLVFRENVALLRSTNGQATGP
jgi:hypothetical protein